MISSSLGRHLSAADIVEHDLGGEGISSESRTTPLQGVEPA
jgi:hypothetical protein